MMCLVTMPKPLTSHSCKSLLLVLFEKHACSEKAGDISQGSLSKMGTLSPAAFQNGYTPCAKCPFALIYLEGFVNHKLSIALWD